MSEQTEPKDRIKAALRAQIEADLASATEYESEEHGAAQVDPDDVYDVDDQSQSDESADMANLAQHAIDGDRASLDALDARDLSPTEVVRPGAVVSFDGQHYLVGIVARAFEADGVTYEGIAPESPVAMAIDGLAEGGAFTVNGTEHRLDSVR